MTNRNTLVLALVMLPALTAVAVGVMVHEGETAELYQDAAAALIPDGVSFTGVTYEAQGF